jgi:glycosyltransferase involved in cell wall biosynthesis
MTTPAPRNNGTQHTMKILMIAPEPFFEPRGTPFSEYFRIKALTELGHQVDLATYPMGKNVEMPGLRIYRSTGLFLTKKVKVGPSLQKLPLDFFLFFTVLKLLRKNKYDCIHTHEEACFMGAMLSRLLKIPHVYDMHSSLPQQFINFNVTRSVWIHRILQFFERIALRSSDAIIAICPYLGEHVETEANGRKVFVIENTPEAETLFNAPSISKESGAIEKRLEGKSVILYAGTFEHYQGLDLLMQSIPHVLKSAPNAFFMLIGGDPASTRYFRKLSEELGVSEAVLIMEKIPVEEVSDYFEIADVVVSPRKAGTNTPLKIYSYLRSGKPIVATNLVTHTQVLDRDIAILTEPNPNSFAEGIVEALLNPRVPGMVQRARQVAEERYSYDEYVAKTSRLYDYVMSLRKPDQYLNDVEPVV